MNKIGFIGLGTMGLPISINLIKRLKSRIYGFDVNYQAIKEFEKNGGIYLNKIDIYKDCNIIILCLPTNDLISETIDEIIMVANKDTIIIDFSSTSPEIIIKEHELALAKGIHLIDAPVSGGEKGAIEGSLVVMCGGDEEIYHKIEFILDAMAVKVRYMGKSGNGSISKLANNMIVAVNLASISEAFCFAKKAGINPLDLFDIIKDGFAGSAVMESKIPKILSRDFSPSARVSIHKKDLVNAEQYAKHLNVKLHLTNKVLEDMQKLEDRGLAGDDHCAVVKIYEDEMGVIVQ